MVDKKETKEEQQEDLTRASVERLLEDPEMTTVISNLEKLKKLNPDAFGEVKILILNKVNEIEIEEKMAKQKEKYNNVTSELKKLSNGDNYREDTSLPETLEILIREKDFPENPIHLTDELYEKIKELNVEGVPDAKVVDLSRCVMVLVEYKGKKIMLTYGRDKNDSGSITIDELK